MAGIHSAGKGRPDFSGAASQGAANNYRTLSFTRETLGLFCCCIRETLDFLPTQMLFNVYRPNFDFRKVGFVFFIFYLFLKGAVRKVVGI